MSVHLNILYQIYINFHRPENYAELTVLHGFNLIFIHHTVK